jgi:PAT family beta-lactamase induction signal transducer AmpG
MLLITLKAPEPEEKLIPPATLKEAVWLPFLGFLKRHRALEILAFVILYKFGDNLAGTLLRPFLVDMGYSDFDRGVALGTVGLASTLSGTFLGGLLTNVIGLGHSLWIFGIIQILSNVGYVLVASYPPIPPLMYSAMGFENFTQGLGMGAFSVLLLRMTQRRFSATQYALFSSLFGVSRVLAGPLSGLIVDAIGWKPFFWGTMIAGIPGLIMLARFVPPGVREPEFEVRQSVEVIPLSRSQIAIRSFLSGLAAFGLSAFFFATMAAVKTMRAKPPGPFEPMHQLRLILIPPDLDHWITLGGLLIFGVIAGMFTAAILAARAGAGPELDAIV